MQERGGNDTEDFSRTHVLEWSKLAESEYSREEASKRGRWVGAINSEGKARLWLQVKGRMDARRTNSVCEIY